MAASEVGAPKRAANACSERGASVAVEEFVDGREIYLGILIGAERDQVEGLGLGTKEVDRTKNFFALGILSSMPQ